jgi:hypothetical protein
MTDFAQIAQAISIILACFAAISGIDAWKREFIGKRKIEIAENMLSRFYQVRDAISIIRNPWGSSDEGKSRKKGESERAEESEILDRAYVVYERYEKQKEVFMEFNMMKYKFMASFGKDTEEIFTRVNKILNSIFLAARMLGTYYWQSQRRLHMKEEQLEKHFEKMERQEKIFWDESGENDEIRKELANILESIEKVTAPCFEEPSTLYSMLTKKIFKSG